MTEEQLMADVARILVERDVSPPELQALARGTLGRDALGALRRGALDEPALDVALRAHEPLSDLARDRITARLLQELAVPAGSTRVTLIRATPRRDAERARGSARRAPLVVRRFVQGLPLLAAAAVFAVVLRSGSVASIPNYRMELVPTRSEQRSAPRVEDANRLALVAGQPVSLVLRPDVSVAGDIGVAVWVAEEGLPPVQQSVAVESSSAGVLRLKFVWTSTATRGRLLLLVGRPGQISREPALGSDVGRGWQRFELPFVAAPL